MWWSIDCQKKGGEEVCLIQPPTKMRMHVVVDPLLEYIEKMDVSLQNVETPQVTKCMYGVKVKEKEKTPLESCMFTVLPHNQPFLVVSKLDTKIRD